MRDRKEVYPHGRGGEVGGVEGGNTVIVTYYVRKKSTFNKTNKQKKQSSKRVMKLNIITENKN